jgi:2-oxoisovalerate dehydrogenase E1 component
VNDMTVPPPLAEGTQALPEGLAPAEVLRLYEQMLLLRRFELAAQVACRKGETPGFLHLYIGQEASAVGVCAHLRRDDWITSTHRGHGHALAKGMDPNTLMAELYGKRDGCCGGRGGTMHLYDPSCGLFGTNGLVGGGIPSAVGVGISARTRGTDGIGVAFFGDGATNHAAFHESLNFAGAQDAPVVFVCENNLYATATALSKATRNPEIATRAAAYGIAGEAVDGNDLLAVWSAMRQAAHRARAGQGPTLLEIKTYRVVAHHEGDSVVGGYRTQAEVDAWARRDPLRMLRERTLLPLGLATQAQLDAIEARVKAQVAAAIEFARNSPEPDPATVALHIYAEPLNPPAALAAARQTNAFTVTTGWLDAVRDGLAEEMRRDPHILYFGEGTGERGGTFAHTKGLFTEFGGQRMVDTPISELGFTGAALGASATGVRCVADLMFADFLFEAAGQIVLQAAKLRYMSNGQMQAPMVLRAGAGAVRSAGPHHSGMYHPVWAHVPGLVVCVPSTPADAKGLMKTALRAGDPVLMLESKALFATRGEVPTGDHLVPFGVARVARAGTDVTIASAGQLVHLSLQAAEQLQAQGISCEVIDLRTIQPLDVDTVAASVRKTGRLLVADEGWAMCGVGAELGQAMQELAFDYLDAPVARLHTDAMSHPFAPALERAMLVQVEGIVAAAKDLMAGVARAPRRLHSGVGGAAGGMVVAPVASPVPGGTAPASTFSESPSAVAAVSAASGSASDEPAAPAASHFAPAMASRDVLPGEALCMPFGDLTVSEGRLVRWLKQVGDAVTAGEIVVEIETEKAVVEVESTCTGTIAQLLESEGSQVRMGQQIAVITPAGD